MWSAQRDHANARTQEAAAAVGNCQPRRRRSIHTTTATRLTRKYGGLASPSATPSASTAYGRSALTDSARSTAHRPIVSASGDTEPARDHVDGSSATPITNHGD